MVQSLICDKEQINSKLKELQEAGTSEDGTDSFYIDPTNREPWILTSYESDRLDCDIHVLMKAELSSKDLIEIAVSSIDAKVIVVAAMTLKYKEEHEKSEFRHELINRLETVTMNNLSKEEKQRLELIIYESNLYDATKQRSIMGKHYTEIEKDAFFYQGPANKAKKILELRKA
jgi:hypothetical protein